MKINFLLDSYKPNFKASFADDGYTKAQIKEMAKSDPIDTLAINLALKDIKSDDKLQAWSNNSVFRNKIIFNNIDNKQMAIIRDTCLKPLLQDLCGESKGLYGFSFKLFGNKKAKFSSEEYLDKAVDIIEKQGDYPRKHEKQYLISAIAEKEHEISQIKSDVAKLRTQLDTIRADENVLIAELVEKLINNS